MPYDVCISHTHSRGQMYAAGHRAVWFKLVVAFLSRVSMPQWRLHISILLKYLGGHHIQLIQRKVWESESIRVPKNIQDLTSPNLVLWASDFGENAMKKSAQRRRKHWALAVVRRNQKFSPTAAPYPLERDGQNLTSWRWSLPLPTNLVWWRSMHSIPSYRGNRPTHKHTPTHPPTDRTDYNTLRRR